MAQFESLNRPIAELRQTARKDGPLSDAYYVLVLPDGSEVGGRTKGILERLARKEGYATHYTPLPPKQRATTAWDIHSGRM